MNGTRNFLAACSLWAGAGAGFFWHSPAPVAAGLLVAVLLVPRRAP